MKNSKITKTVATALAALMLMSGCSEIKELIGLSDETEANITEEETTVEQTEETTTETSEETEATESTTVVETTVETTKETEATEETEQTEETKETTNNIGVNECPDKAPNYMAKLPTPEISKKELSEDTIEKGYEAYFDGELTDAFGRAKTDEYILEGKYESGADFKDLMPDLSGLIGYSVKDFDNDGTPDMIAYGLLKADEKVNKKSASNYYIPFFVLCQTDYDSISVKDMFIYEPEDPEGYDYGSTHISSSLITDSKMQYFVFDDKIVFSFADWGNGFAGDGSYLNAIELKVADNKIKAGRIIYQYAGGSAEFEYAMIDTENDLIATIQDMETKDDKYLKLFDVKGDADMTVSITCTHDDKDITIDFKAE